MEITADEFKLLCDDIDAGGVTRELTSHHEIYQFIEFLAAGQKCMPIIISTVNKYLAVPEDRNKGFQVLHIIFKHLPIAVVEEKAIVWSNFAVEFNRIDANSERFLVLAEIMKICSENNNQDFNRHVTSVLLKRIIDKCLSLQPLLKSAVSVHYAIIHILNICVQTYPGACGHYKPQIEAFLLKYLDAPNRPGVIDEAGACLHFLQQTGPAGPNRVNHINNWVNQMRKLCATIHDLYDHVFDDNMFDFEPPEVEGYTFEHMNSCDSLHTVLLNSRRLQGLIVFLREMLRLAYPVEKIIYSKIILDVVQRILSIPLKKDNLHVIENTNLWVRDLKLAVLVAFKHWVNISGAMNAKVFHSNIFEMLFNSIKNIEEPSSLYSEYYMKLLNAFSFYISRVKPSISQKYQDQMIQHSLKFIKPTTSNVELNIDVSIAGKSTRGKKQLIDERIIDSGTNMKKHLEEAARKEARETLCIATLKALSTIFGSIPVDISENTCLDIFDTVIPILNDLQRNSPKSPYDNENCQVEIYNFLLKIYEQPFLPRHISLSVGLMYFNSALLKDNRSVKVTDVCEKAISSLEKLCQPMCSSLYMSETCPEPQNSKGKGEQAILGGAWIKANDNVLLRVDNNAEGSNIEGDEEAESEENNEAAAARISPTFSSEHAESPTYSLISTASKKGKVNIPAVTIIPSPNSRDKSSAETIKIKPSLSEISLPMPIMKTMEIKEDEEDESSSVFSKETIKVDHQEENAWKLDDPDNSFVADMLASFVPDPDF